MSLQKAATTGGHLLITIIVRAAIGAIALFVIPDDGWRRARQYGEWTGLYS